MKKNTQKLKPDTVLKDYWEDNERFADLFNAVLFDGRKVIRPEELTSVDSEGSTVFRHRKHAESLVSSRDKIKVRKKSTEFGVELELVGQENQEHIHYAMPMRLMGYDYTTYKKQYDDNARKYKTPEGLTRDEFLSKMKREDKLVPVITIVVYYGEKPWDGARTLHEMLSIPQEMKPFVNDYRMLLVEAGRTNLPLCNTANAGLFEMLGIAFDSTKPAKQTREELIKYAKENAVGTEVVMAVAGAANYQIDYSIFEKGDDRMYRVFEETLEEGRAEGEVRGIIKIGKKHNMSSEAIIEDLMSECGITEEEAQKYLAQYKTAAQ